MAVSSRNLAIVIGINAYQRENGIKPLGTAVNDARAIAQLLKNEYKYSQVWELLDEQATYEGIKKLLNETLPEEVRKSDRLVFYFAGHGIARKGKDGSPAGYLIPQNAKVNLQTSENKQSENFLPMQELYDAFNTINCHHLLVILDCCYAGMFRWATRKLLAVPERIYKQHYDRFIKYPSWQVLASAAHNQEALDLVTDERGTVRGTNHSPFALALLQGLGHTDDKLNADLTGDGVITTPELYLYVDKEVNRSTGERQTPGFWSLRHEYDRGEFIFTKPDFNPAKNLTIAPEPNPSNNPYRGLKSFEERHASFFFGRKALVEKLQRRLSQPNHLITVVLGASGSGKSSLVKAGLIPALRQRSQWYILEPMRPDRSPFTALARAILPVEKPELLARLSEVNFLDEAFKPKEKSGQAEGDEPTNAAFVKLADSWNSATPAAKLLLVEDYFLKLQNLCRTSQQKEHLSQLYRSIFESLELLSERLQNEPQHLVTAIEKWSNSHPDVKLLLTIDQFEELITMSRESQIETHGSDKQQSDRAAEPQPWLPFLEVLREAIVGCSQQLHIVLTLRSDFEPRFLSSPLLAYWKDARFPIRAMNLDELRQAIEGPALKQALYFDPPELVGKLIDEVGQMPGSLPLLSFTLSELYIKLAQRWQEDPNSSDRALRIQDYEELGGVAGALTRRATEEYDNLIRDFGETSGKTYQATMRRVMLRMLSLEGGEVARRRVPESELIYPNDGENQRVAQVSDRLLKARLLVKGQETGEPYIEPAHDFLVRGWNKLRDWLKEENNLELQRRLTPAALEWKTQQQVRFLWNANPYLEVLKKELNKSLENNWLNRVEAEFVQRSVARKHFNICRRWSSIAGAFLLLSAATLRAIFNGINAQNEALVSSSSLADSLFVADRQLDALKTAIRTGEQLKQMENKFFLNHIFVKEDTKFRVLTALQQIVYHIQEQNHLQGHPKPVFSVSFSPSGQILASGSSDGTIKLWRRNGQFIQTLHHAKDGERVFRVIFTSDGQSLISASQKDIKIWQHQPDNTFTFRQHIPDRDGISALGLHPDNQTIATANSSTQKSIKLWSLDGKLFNSFLSGHGDVINDLSFSPDGKTIASASADRIIKLWSWSRNNLKLLATIKENAQLYSVLFVNHRTIASASGDGTIKLRKIDSPKIATEFQERHSSKVVRLVLSSDGKTIASASADRTIKLWNLEDRKLLDTFRGHDNNVLDISFSPDGKIIASASEDRTIEIWNRDRLAPDLINGKSISFSPDSKTIVTAKDKTIYLWRRDRQLVKSFRSGHQENINQVRFSPDGQTIASASADRTIKLWNLQGNCLGTFPGHTKSVTSISFSPNGKIIASASLDKTIKLWDINDRDRKFQKNFNTGSVVASISFSSDGKTIASANSDSTVKLWTLNGNLSNKTLQGHKKAVLDVSFSPDGKTIASASADQTVRLWHLEEGTSKVFSHQAQVNRVAFSPSGKILASASEDKTIKFWNLDGKLLQDLRGFNTSIVNLSFSRDYNTLAAVDNRGKVMLQNLNLDNLLKISCNFLGDYLNSRPLNSQENLCTKRAPSPL